MDREEFELFEKVEENQRKTLILLENIFKLLSKYDKEYNEEIMKNNQ